MPIFRDHPLTSVTVKINQIASSHRDDIDDSPELFLRDLLELIRLQGSGPSEAARAIRKKVKYGNSAEQLRALQVLELLISNSGSKIGPVIARDDKLIDVLKGIINGSGKTGDGTSYPKEVQVQTQGMAVEWKSELADLEGYKYFAVLWKQIPKYKKSHSRTSSRHVEHRPDPNVFESELDNAPQASPRPQSPRAASPRISSPPPRPTASFSDKKDSKKRKSKSRRSKRNGTKYADDQFKIPQINYSVEAPKIRTLIASTHTNSTALTNQLVRLPAGQSPMGDKKCVELFEKCRSNRRKVLRYLQYVGAGGSDKPDSVVAMDEEFLGSLITANEQLVDVFKKFDFHCGYTDANPAPAYNDEEDSDESYYTDTSEEDDDDDDVSAAADRLQEVTVGTSSSAAKKAPPPRPNKPSQLAFTRPVLSKTDTNASTASDPFGDNKGVTKSLYD